MAERPFAEIYEELRRTFVASTRERLVRMRKTLDNIAVGSSDAVEEIRVLRRDAHGLRGLGGTYGYPLVTEAADRLETLATDRDRMESADRDKARLLVDAIERALAMPDKPAPAATDAFVRDLPTVGNAD